MPLSQTQIAAKSALVKLVLPLALVAMAWLTLQRYTPIRSFSKPSTPRFTNPTIAIDNLNSQILSLEKLLAKQPENFSYKQQLFDRLKMRTSFLGKLDDLWRIQEIANSLGSSAPELILLARYQLSIHAFASAREILDKALGLAPKEASVTKQKGYLALATSRDFEAINSELRKISSHISIFEQTLMQAELASNQGEFLKADHNLQAAIDDYGDSSPFPIAQLYFQRGLLWAEKAQDPALAMRYYSRAVEILPQYAVAQVHLAELEAQAGMLSNAIERLKPLADVYDPEPAAVLGELLISDGNAIEGQAYITKASERYAVLLRDFPLAFADHGSEFYIGAGARPGKGLELALINLENRPTERAYSIAIEAAIAAKDDAKLCKLVLAARALNPVFVGLQQQLEEHPCK